MKQHTCSIETLSHFNCYLCGQWFSISECNHQTVIYPACGASARYVILEGVKQRNGMSRSSRILSEAGNDVDGSRSGRLVIKCNLQNETFNLGDP